MHIKILSLLSLILISLSGCTMHARLYLANKQASNTIMPNKEALKGEYTTIDTSTQTFGAIYTSVYSNRGNAICIAK